MNETRYFLTGNHLIRVLCEDDNPMQAERYESAQGHFVIDNKMITAIVNDMDAVRLSELEYYRYKRSLNHARG